MVNKKLLMSLAIFSSSFVIGELTDSNEAQANTKTTTNGKAKQTKQTKQTSAPAAQATYTLNTNVKTYVTAANAAAKTNAKGTYSKGVYYVYNTNRGMLNVSRSKGSAGAWINPSDNQVTTKPTTPQAANQTPKMPTPAPKTENVKPNSTANQAAKPLETSSLVGRQFSIASDVKIYTTANDAVAGRNAKGIYGKGNYYIYKHDARTSMVNISKVKGRAGAWANLIFESAPTTKVPEKTEAAKTQTPAPVTKETPTQKTQTSTKTETPKKQETTTPETGEYKVYLYNAEKVYLSAANAASGTNPRGVYGQGEYYVYKTKGNMYNISKTKGRAGGWINAHAILSAGGSAPDNISEQLESAQAPKKAETTKTPAAKAEKSTTKPVENTVKPQDKGSNAGVRNNYGKYSKVIYLDAGHGGTDSGAVYFGQSEKNLNLSIFNKLSTQLKKEGYTIMSTRSSDTYTGLQQISEKVNASNADIFVSIHFNAAKSASVNGIETYWYQNYKEYPSRINKDNHLNPDRLRRSQVLAEGIHSNLVSETKATNRGVRRDTYSVLRETAIPAVLLELGYMSNQQEAKNIANSAYQDKLVQGIVKGIKNYYAKA